MHVLILGPNFNALKPVVDANGDTFVSYCDKNLTPLFCLEHEIDFIVSYGYRYIISQDIISLYPNKIINLHISLLPFSRGSHPIVWSIYKDHPLGVTIHHIDSGLDTGNIICQSPMIYDDLSLQSFRSLHKRASLMVEALFAVNWKYLRLATFSGYPQLGPSSYHKTSDLIQLQPFMPDSWDTKIDQFLFLSSR